jgi:protein transport protein SEC31
LRNFSQNVVICCCALETRVLYFFEQDQKIISMQQQSRSLPVLKEIQSASSIAWAPSSYDKTILAAGNVQGMLDENFQTSAKLELYSADLSAPGKDPFFLGSVAVTQCNFSKIAWGSKGTQDSSHSMGIIAGGMSNGALHLWDAAKITEDPQKALLGKFDKHRGPILGLDFNHVHPNLLATSSADGEVLVWDLANMSAPTASKPTADGQSMSRFGVSAVAWNSQVPHVRLITYVSILIIL